MNIIELERWKPSQTDPRKMEYAGQPIAQEVFEELKHRLEGMGYLPDEYFLMDHHWEDGREIPKGADIFCTTDYGGSEGVYLDVYLKWYEEGKPITKSFITGKTLGENGNDLDRMDCIELASALSLFAYGRELRQLGDPHAPEELVEELRRCILPHQNRSSLKNRTAELAVQTRSVLEKASTPGIRSEAEKRELADSWLELAVSFVKVPVKYEAELIKQQQKQEQTIVQQQEMG